MSYKKLNDKYKLSLSATRVYYKIYIFTVKLPEKLVNKKSFLNTSVGCFLFFIFYIVTIRDI